MSPAVTVRRSALGVRRSAFGARPLSPVAPPRAAFAARAPEGHVAGRLSPVRRGLPLVLALGLDVALGEPPAVIHPVVWMGRLAAALERRAPVGRRAQRSGAQPCPAGSAHARLVYGACGAASIAGASILAGRLVEQVVGRLHPLPRLLALSWLLKSTFALRSLAAAAEAVRAPLQRRDLAAARAALHSLVGRDVATLGPSLLAAAAVESVAENTSDALVAPALFYMLGGLPAALGYRAINTLDAMWGYHGAYEHLGKTAARADDLVNLLPARLTGLLVVGASLLDGDDAAGAWRTMWRDHGRTASPNAGWPMSAMAGALGVELEKVGHYRLGAPAALPTPAMIRRSVRLVYVVVALLIGACVLGEVGHYAMHRC